MKKNIIFALKLTPNFILASILTFMSLPISLAIKNNLSVVFTSIMPIILLYFLVYKSVWLEGFRSPNRIKLGQEIYFKYKGLVVGVFVIVPSLIFLLIYILTKSLIFAIPFYILNFNLFPLNTIFPNTYYILYFIIILFIPIISTIAYHLGFKRIELLKNIMYKKTK